MSWENMETVPQEGELPKDKIPCRLLSQLRKMAIPSPPSISSSSEDSDDVSEEDDENAAFDYIFAGRKQDLATQLLLTEEDRHKDFSNLSLVCPETQARLEALLEAAGVAADGKAFNDPEVLRRLTSSVSSALDEAAAALTRMRTQTGGATVNHIHDQGTRSLVEACIDGDIVAVRKLLDEGRNVNEPTDEGESLLSLACSAGYYELVQVLLAMNANVEDRGSKGDCTPLMEAASGGFVEIVKLLLEHSANANAQSSSGNTALHYACCGGYEDVVQVLLSHNADLEHQNENGHTPLMEAASGGHVPVAKLLLEKGAGINTHSSEFKESALTLACYKGHVNMVKFLLEKGADQEHKTDEMHTALMEASMDGHVEVARLLLEHGAQVNMPADSFESPLTLAACGSHVDLARLLIDHGAKLEEVNDEGYTPLMEAAREGYLPMVALLLEKGANINAQTEETQETALTLAACGGFQDVVDYLISEGADIELGAPTPLMEAATEGHVELVRFLLDRGADVNAQTATGDTALTYACENGHTLVAEVLLKAGSDMEHEAEGGRTAVMKAARAGHVCTVDYLITQNALINKVTSNNDHSVLSLACAGGHTAVVKLLLMRGADPTLKLKDNSSMLIEAAKGGHTSVACLLLDSHLHSPLRVALPDSPARSGFLTPITPEGSPTGHVTPYQTISHDHHHQLHQHQHECLQGCPHVPPLPTTFGTHTCNFVTPPPIVQPAPPSTHAFSTIPTSFVAPPFTTSAGPSNPVTSSADVLPPNVSVSLPSSSLPFANLTPADLQSLAQALSFSASVNSMTSPDAVISTSATVAENLGLSTAVNFPVIDPSLMGMGISPGLGSVGLGGLAGTDDIACLPLDAQPGIAVTSGPRTVTSTGVQTEDTLSMIHKLTNVQQLNALQNFAASHNLELVNLGEITLPPSPYTLNVAQEDAIMVAEPARPLQDTLAHLSREGPLQDTLSHITREEPDGGCSSPIPVPGGQTLSEAPLTPPPPMILDIDQATESNHDTALTIACAGGHDELVQLLIAKGADIEHRDKKGCTPLILSATAGHASTCRILLDSGSDIEAQSDRTKDTALSLACSSGRQEVVELLLARGANYEHRNVSDYTPLSLAASGGYVGIIKVLLNHGAEINSRTGSKLGISPLMLAAMNGHVAAVKLLLDMGSDVNAQIETNRNTALTLACFQGRQEVVGLLLDRKAFVEHRAKTGLTPLMEAASGGYVEVGRVLIDRGADVNAPAVPSSRDTALTIAADKGHYKFVELLLSMGACIDVKNKKGCSPLWLAANGGHLDVVQLLAKAKADVDSQDNRCVSCLMAAFRKGHVKVVKWLVKHVTQFPADPDCKRFMQTVTDKDLLKKLQECMEIIITAKERQAAEANKNASILLEELDHEKQKEARRRAAAAKKRDKKKQKKKRKAEQGQDQEMDDGDQDQEDDELEVDERNREHEENAKNIAKGAEYSQEKVVVEEREKISMPEEKPAFKMPNGEIKKSGNKKEKRDKGGTPPLDGYSKEGGLQQTLEGLNSIVITTAVSVVTSIRPTDTASTTRVAEITKAVATSIISSSKLSKPRDSVAISAEVAATMATAAAQCAIVSLSSSGNASSGTQASSPKKSKRTEEGWKEVTRRSKKIQIPAALISRVIGRGGCNVNAIREHTSAHIDIDTNRKKPNGDCMVTIKGSQQATRQAYNLIEALIQDPEKDVAEILPQRPRKYESSPIASALYNRKPSPPSISLAAAQRITAIATSARVTSLSSQISTSSLQRSITAVTTSHSQQVFSKQSAKQSVFSTVHRLPPRMGGTTSLNTAKVDSVTISSQGWGGTLSQGVSPPIQIKKAQTTKVSTVNTDPISSPQPSSSSLATCIVTTTKSPAARQLFPPTTSSSTKSLPMPIGSNRPSNRPIKPSASPVVAVPGSRNSRSSALSVNVDAESRTISSLDSLFSQVATQVRSPMIWNDLGGTGLNDPPVVSDNSPPHQLLNGLPSSMTTSSTSVVLSQASASSPSTLTKAMSSPVTSLSPSSSQSDSPTSLAHEERPHLNPIGCERAHKRTSSTSMANVPALQNFISGSEAGRQNVWSFGFPSSATAPSSWPVTSSQGTTHWATTTSYSTPTVNADVGESLSGAEVDEEGVDIRPDDTLQSLLERLSLSKHLPLFQKNEIDLEALLLMSEQDYADIGLSKGPRVKLINSTRGLATRSEGNTPSQNPPPPTNHVGLVAPSPQQIWSGTAAVMSVPVPTPVIPANPRPGPLLTDPMRFPPTAMMAQAWRPWSRGDR